MTVDQYEEVLVDIPDDISDDIPDEFDINSNKCCCQYIRWKRILLILIIICLVIIDIILPSIVMYILYEYIGFEIGPAIVFSIIGPLVSPILFISALVLLILIIKVS